VTDATAEMDCACPAVYPDWNDTDVDLAGQCVHDMGFPTLFHMPLSYDTYVKKQAENIEQLELKEKWPGFILTRTGFLRGRMLRILDVAETASRLVRYLPSPFMVRADLHPGGMGTVAKTIQSQHIKMSDMGRSMKEMYLAHLTCPVCEERKGGDKILVIRRWIENPGLQMRLDARKARVER